MRFEPQRATIDGAPLQEVVIHEGAGGKPSEPIPSALLVGWLEPRAVADSFITLFLLESEIDTTKVQSFAKTKGTFAEKVQRGLRGELASDLFRAGSVRRLRTQPDGRFQFLVDRVHQPGKNAFVLVNDAGQWAVGRRQLWKK